MESPTHLSLDQLQAGLPEIRQSPADDGTLQSIVIRPKTDQRVRLLDCRLSPELGVHGDNWADGCWMSLPDGTPHPDVQVAIMNARAVALIAGEGGSLGEGPRDRWSPAGDNLFIDLDLSSENLPPGQQVRIGQAVLEITAVAHDGCRKFAQRYGADAVRFVNSKVGKQLHLRGIYAKVITAGDVRVGDVVSKIQN